MTASDDDHGHRETAERASGSSGRDSIRAVRNPFAEGVSRRRLLRSSTAAGGAAALAGCSAIGREESARAPTVYVFNTGDRTVSVIDAESDEVVETAFVDTTASFPANQYGTGVDEEYDVLWLNVDGGVVALDAATLEGVASAETGFVPNYPNLSPDHGHLVVAAGGTTTLDPDPADPPNHVLLRVDADPESESFGEETGRIDLGYAGPCDATFAPGGEFLFVPNIVTDELLVVRVDPFEVATRLDVEALDAPNPRPFMATASFGGDVLLVENAEGELGSDGERRGSESVWDVSDPKAPEEVARITRDDGLPGMPLTSEVTPDGETGYVFTPGSGDVTVVDVPAGEVATRIDVGGRALSGAWGPRREKLYVPVQTEDRVAVIGGGRRELLSTIEVGSAPVGAVGGMVRPRVEASRRIEGALSAVGVPLGDRQPTYCVGDCFCGE